MRAIEAPVLYPSLYCWTVFAGAMDVMMTYVVLYVGGYEANALAASALEAAGLWGLIALKFTMLALVLAICEYVGRKRASTGVLLARAAIALNVLPVAAAFVQLGAFWPEWVERLAGV